MNNLDFKIYLFLLYEYFKLCLCLPRRQGRNKQKLKHFSWPNNYTNWYNIIRFLILWIFWGTNCWNILGKLITYYGIKISHFNVVVFSMEMNFVHNNLICILCLSLQGNDVGKTSKIIIIINNNNFIDNQHGKDLIR